MRTVQWANAIATPKTIYNGPTDAFITPADFRLVHNYAAPRWSVVTWTPRTQRDVLTMKAKKFVELVDGGLSQDKAAAQIGETTGFLKKSKENFGKEIQSTLETYGWLPKDVKREYLRSKQLEILDRAMDAVAADPTDSKMLKVALDATRAIGEDVEMAVYEKRPSPVAPPAATQPALPPALMKLLDLPKEEPPVE